MFHNKYLKYKKKYNELKKQVGGIGEIKSLQGPVSIDYYTNDNGKKIIVMGDIHHSLEGGCTKKDDMMEIPKYLNEIFQLDSSILSSVDFFIETDIPLKPQLKSGNLDQINSIDYLSQLGDLAITNYKKNPTRRMHFTDIRGKELQGFNVFYKFEHLLYLLHNIHSFKKDMSLFNFFYDHIESFTKSLFHHGHILKEKKFDYMIGLSEHLLKELDKSYKSNPDIVNKLSKITLNYIRPYLDIMLDEKNQPNITLDNLDKLEKIYDLGKYASAALNDLYLILRIMKNDEFNNCILYVGKNHCEIICNYLTSIGFKINKCIRSNEPNIRCVSDILPFHEFFNQS
jgi:hypothetical protein